MSEDSRGAGSGSGATEAPMAEKVRKLEDEVRRLERDAGKQIAKLKTLNEIGRSIAAVLDVPRILELICDLVTKNLNCDLSSVMLVEPTGDLVMKAARGIPEEVARKIRIRLGQGYAGKVAQSGQSLFVSEGDKRPTSDSGERPAADQRARYHGGSFAVVPIILERLVIGVINVTNKRAGAGLEPDDLGFLETIASYAAVAIENARLHAKAQLLAATDGLTELYNHRYFQERLAEEVERWRRYWVKGVALVMLDLDRFKRFNDMYGHRAGDAVLREAALRVKRQARKVDVCCRYGGEEFAVILPEIDKAGAVTFAERVRETMSREPFLVRDGIHTKITVSVGIAACPEDANDPADLIEAADRALYVSKKTGRDRVTVAGEATVGSVSGPIPGADTRKYTKPAEDKAGEKLDETKRDAPCPPWEPRDPRDRREPGDAKDSRDGDDSDRMAPPEGEVAEPPSGRG
jgi:diguanylate cyclase (GGDEF)-like protein